MNRSLQLTLRVVATHLTLRWRSICGNRLQNVFTILLLTLFVGAAHFLMWQAFGILQVDRIPLWLEAAMWNSIALWMLGFSINENAAMFCDRVDDDFLLSSPLAPIILLGAQLMCISISVFTSIALLMTPLLDILCLKISLQNAVGFAVWIGLAVVVTALGNLIVITLVRLFGMTRAHKIAQLLMPSLVVIAVFSFLTWNYMSQGRAGDPFIVMRHLEGGIFSLLARAARADAYSLAGIAGLALLLPALSVVFTSQMLTRVLQAADEQTNTSIYTKSYDFTGCLGYVTFKKELRLLLRDRLLIGQMLLSVLWIAPACLSPFMLYGLYDKPGTMIVMLAPLTVAAAGELTGCLTAICVSGEEYWELIKSSPASYVHVRVGKMFAGIAIPLMVTIVLCMVIACSGRPSLSLISGLVAVVVAVTISWLGVNKLETVARSQIIQKRGRTFGPLRIVELVLSCGGAFSVGLLIFASSWTVSAFLMLFSIVLGTIWFGTQNVEGECRLLKGIYGSSNEQARQTTE